MHFRSFLAHPHITQYMRFTPAVTLPYFAPLRSAKHRIYLDVVLNPLRSIFILAKAAAFGEMKMSHKRRALCYNVSVNERAKQIEIIPAINADSFEEIKRRVKLVEPFVEWVQIDAADGTFTKNTIWHNPEDLAFLETPLKIELHLMLDKMERRIGDWLLPNVHRIIFHISATNDPDFVIKKCKEAGKQVGIAVGPSESFVKAMGYRKKVDLFQILDVYPGLSGSEIVESSSKRTSELRDFCGECIIEVDGGMNKKTVKVAVDGGANIIVAASAIFGAEDVGKAIEELKKEANKK